MDDGKPLAFEVECGGIVQEFRESLDAVYAAIGMDPAQPQEMARRFGLNKTLTWHLSRLLREESALLGMPHIPGTFAMEKVLSAALSAGAGPELVERVRGVMRRYDRVIERHVGDRTTLDLMLDGMGTEPEYALEASRRLAFRGMSGIRGVQVQTTVLNAIVHPSAKGRDRVDVAAINGYIGIRRLRPNVRCMLMTSHCWEGQESKRGHLVSEPIFAPSSDRYHSTVLEHYGERGHAGRGIEMLPTDHGLDIILAPGEVGNQSLFDLAVGEVLRSIGSRYAQEGDRTGEVSLGVSIPSERLVFDLLYHQELDFVGSARSLVFDTVDTNLAMRYLADDSPARLPLCPRVTDLGASPLVLATPHVPGHAMLARQMCERLGWVYEDLRGLRIELEHPPINSTVVLRFDLPERG